MYVISSYAKVFWQILRPKTLILIWLHLTLGYILLSNVIPSIQEVVLGFLLTALAYMHAVAINDFSDEEVDKLNAKFLRQDNDRPLLSNTLSARKLWWIAQYIGVVFITLSFFVVWWMSIIALIIVILNMIYSLPPVRISSRGIWAQLLLPVMYVGFPMCLALAITSQLNAQFIVIGIGLYIHFAGRLFLKDLRDEQGDRKAGKRTFLVRHGQYSTFIISVSFIVTGILIMAVGAVLNDANIYGLVIAGVLSIVGIIWAARVCYYTKDLSHKLLYIAVIGRFASMWVFVILLSKMLYYSKISFFDQILIETLIIGIFAFGVRILFDELAILKKRQAIAKRK